MRHERRLSLLSCAKTIWEAKNKLKTYEKKIKEGKYEEIKVGKKFKENEKN